MSHTLILFGLCLFTTLVTSSRRDEVEHASQEELAGNTTELRGSISSEDKTKFLGRGFNLLHCRGSYRDVEDITNGNVLSQSRLNANTPWAPWGGEVLEEAFNTPQLRIKEVTWSLKLEEVHDVAELYEQDSIEISVGANSKKIVLKFWYSVFNSEEERVLRIRQYTSKVSEDISWVAQKAQTYRYYLDNTFVNSLRHMPADSLVDTYGTHAITGYSLGAFSDLLITARKSVFSENELRALAKSAFNDEVKLPPYLSSKVQENVNSISTTYRQGGSEYAPPSVSPQTLFSTSTPTLIDLASWEKGIRKDNPSFISIKSGIIPIPDLIENLNLKVKYASAIVHKIHSMQDIIYVLCSPDNFEPVKYNGEYVYTSLKQYLGGANYVYYGNNSTKSMSEKQLTGNGSSDACWRSKLDNEGLWVFYNTASARYLCRDFKMRRKDEDLEGLRYWALNPIIPEDDYSQKEWSRMMIRLNSGH